MILLDSDILLIDRRYTNDPRHAVNRLFLQQAQASTMPLGITTQAILEVIGALSFNVSPAKVLTLLDDLTSDYGLIILPDLQQHPEYAACTVNDVLVQIRQQMALGDAVQAVQIARHAGSAVALLTWNARHFVGKMTVPVLTPQEWHNQQSGTTP